MSLEKQVREKESPKENREGGSLGCLTPGLLRRIQSGALQRVDCKHCNPCRPSSGAP